MGLQLQRYSTNPKGIPRKKFLETLSFVLPAKTTVGPIGQRTVVLAGRSKLRVSQNFFRGYLFVFVEYLCNCSLKINTKNIKNYRSILAIVNHRNWLDDSPPLTMQQRIQKSAFFHFGHARKSQIAVVIKQASIIIFQFSNNYNYISFIKLSWPGDSEGTFRSSSQAATYLP